ncbi:MAG: SDR family NAD(P)-dependent oxidoreductase [Actinomycetota bacterium]
MTLTILVTGATDGIGLLTAQRLATLGHHVLLHGRNPAKLADAERAIRAAAPEATVETYRADLSSLPEVDELAEAISSRHPRLDVIINNAGVLKAARPTTDGGLDVRFVVNALAPYRLTERLLPLVPPTGRVVNLSSAAQAPVDVRALAGQRQAPDMDAYAQSKLAITMWTRHLAQRLGPDGPAIIAVNPGSFLATKMVKEGFGMAGNDIGIGADVLVRAALSDEFAGATGQYFDNDAGRFGSPHPDAMDPAKVDAVVTRLASLADQPTAE